MMTSLTSMNIANTLIGAASANLAKLTDQQNDASIQDPVLAAASDAPKTGEDPFDTKTGKSLSDKQIEVALTKLQLEATAEEAWEQGNASDFAAATVAKIEYSKVAEELADKVEARNQADAASALDALDLGIKEDISEMIAETENTEAGTADAGRADSNDAIDKAAEKAEEAIENMTDLRV